MAQFFLENLSLLVGSGMPVLTALRAIKRAAKSGHVFKIAEELESNVSAGHHFWHSLEKTGLFPVYVISLVRIGEETGHLADNLKLLSRQQTKDRMLRESIKLAIIYPLTVLFLTSVFFGLRLQVPLLTRIFIGSGFFLYVVLFVFPLRVGSMLREAELSRFGYVLGNLLHAGVPLVRSLELLSQAGSSKSYSRFYLYLKTGIEDGNSFETCFAGYKKLDKLLPVTVQEIIIAGEQSGRLEEVFTSLGLSYEEKSQMTARYLTGILQPISLIIVWVFFAAVALSIIVPLYSDAPPVVLKTPPSVAVPAPAPASEVKAAEIVKPSLYLTPASSLTFLYARLEPASRSKIVGKIYAGKSYLSLNEQDGWDEVILDNGKTAWVLAEYVQVK